MLYYLQFTLRIHADITAVSWPCDDKHGDMWLTHDPLSSIGYGSEAVAVADLDRWLARFPQIFDAEAVLYGAGADHAA
jgi:hypothetical protein